MEAIKARSPREERTGGVALETLVSGIAEREAGGGMALSARAPVECDGNNEC